MAHPCRSGKPPRRTCRRNPVTTPRLKERNTSSLPRSGAPGSIAALTPADFSNVLRSSDAILVDTRHMLAFGGGHIRGAINIGASGHLSIQAGWMLDADKDLLLVLESDSQVSDVLKDLARTGFDRFAGYLAGGMTAWASAGHGLESLAQLHVKALAAQVSGPGSRSILDVRSPQEWEQGHVPGARHIFLPDLPGALDTLDKSQPLAVYCDTGYRASIAARLLQSHGFEVANVPGSWSAWNACRLPSET